MRDAGNKGTGEVSSFGVIFYLKGNRRRASQLKAYFGWAPLIAQSGRSLDRTRLTPRGSRLMKRTMYLAAWKAIQVEDSEWRRLYEKLIPIKCRYDERLGRYIGRDRVLGRIVGQMISVIFALLKHEELAQQVAQRGHPLAAPELYDPARHRQHRAGKYPGTSTLPPEQFLALPALH